MSPLVLAANFSCPEESDFVVRLGLLETDTDAGLAGEFEDHIVFAKNGRTIAIQRPDETLVGDVIFARPRLNRVDRWIRARSPHNTLLVTERCDQLCLMCSQPPKKVHYDLFDAFRSACLLAPPNITIGISGGEPTLFKSELYDLIEQTLEQRPDLSFHILTNAQHFDQTDRQRLIKPSFRRVLWGVPLYAPTADPHDRVVQKPGAFAQLMKGLSILGESGQRVELRTTLMRATYPDLPRLARFIAARLSFIDMWALMQLERIGFAKARWNELFCDHSRDPAPLSESIAIADAKVIPVALYNIPLCTVPRALEPYLHRSISDWKQTYAPECAACSARERCTGFFAWHVNLGEYASAGAIQ